MAKHKSNYKRKLLQRLKRVNKLDKYNWHWERVAMGTCYELQPGRGYSRVSTQNERRQYAAATEQGAHVRGRRRAKHLPTLWDDKGVARWRVRSWKDGTRCRKQWQANL